MALINHIRITYKFERDFSCKNSDNEHVGQCIRRRKGETRAKKEQYISKNNIHSRIHDVATIFKSNSIWHSKIVRIYLIVLYVIAFAYLHHSEAAYSECKFPEHWWGSWFQKGIPDLIHISKFNISEKGICRRMNGEKFIIENRSDKCVRCLVINERHPNILQYKETNVCHSKTSFDICFDINGDAPLYSLFRVNTSPIKCPFKGPYTFSYSKGINECKDPLSEIDECTDDRRLLLKFKACADIYGSESRVEELECIAEWKEGSFKYLVGKLHHNSATSDEDKFRCFVIEKNNSESIESYNIGQSGDASCDGLFSPRDGLRTFRIRKANDVQSRCDFPRWLVESRHWKTLDNQHTYDFSSSQIFSVINDRRDVQRNSKCIESDNVSFLYKFNASRFVIHTTLGCKSGFACMHAYLREDRIAELQIGNIVPHISEACSFHHFNPTKTQFITLTTLDDSTRECNLKGLYSIKSKIAHLDRYGSNRVANSNYSRLVSFLDSRFICQEKALRLKSSCEDLDQFQFTCSIDNRVKNFKCRGGWRDNNTQFFLVSFIEKFNYEYCVNLNMDTKQIRMIRNSHFCFRESHMPDASTNVLRGLGSKYSEEAVSFHLINEGSCNQNSGSLSSKYFTIMWTNASFLLLQLIILSI